VQFSAFTTAFLTTKDVHNLASVLGFSSYSELAYLIYPSPKYTVFLLKKKNGSDREINVPAKKLKDLQRKLLPIFDELDNSRPSAHGFQKKRSVVTNAQVHSGVKKNFVFNLDLKDFFPSITFARVRGVFISAPFDLPPRVATVLARVCTHKGILPQGAPTSPAISNYICRGLDGLLQQLARTNQSTYTRYADDLTFSFTTKKRSQLPKDLVDTTSDNAGVGEKLILAINEHGFKINQEKVRLRTRHVRMEVTGLTVNEFPNVQRKYIDEIRGMLHSWKAFGLVKAQEGFAGKLYRRTLRTGIRPPFENVLRGKLLYLKMVKQDTDKVYSYLARRFNDCVQQTPGCQIKMLPVSKMASNEKDLEKAIFVVSCSNKDHLFEIKGTGFFLKDVGFVTCNHVLVYPDIPIKDDGEPLYSYPKNLIGTHFDSIFIQDIFETDLCPLEIVWFDINADVAVLRPRAVFEHFELQSVEADLIKKEITLVGFPFHNPGKSLSFADGKIRSRYASFNKQHIDITPLIRQGNSGGPVLDLNYKVIGVAKEGERQDHGNNGVLRIHEVLALHSSHLKKIQAESVS
jgi:RNA-directed DNA polymerase